MKLNLRGARFSDHWRKVYKRRYETALKQLTFRNLGSINDGTVNFYGGITAIVGSNGVGKSTLAAAVGDVLRKDGDETEISHAMRLDGSSLEATFSIKQVSNTFEISERNGHREKMGEPFSGTLVWFDPATSAKNVSAIQGDPTFKVLLSQVKPIELDPDDISVLNFLTNKVYTAGRIYEIPDYQEVERFPYFEVTSFGRTYGTERMGDGEVALFFIFWLLRYLPETAIMVLEEPETHISPRAQQALMDMLAAYSAEEGIQFVITTHSPTVIAKIPTEALIVVISDEGMSRVVTSATKDDIARILGENATYRGALVVEDIGAQHFLSYLLQELAPDLASAYEVVSRTSESEVTAALLSMPKTKPWLKIVGCYDGNMKGRINDANHAWPHRFLPGNTDPDEMLLKSLNESEVARVAARLQLTEDRVRMVRNYICGRDLHDFPSEVAEFTKLPINLVRRSLVLIWLESANNETAAKDFITELRTAVET